MAFDAVANLKGEIKPLSVFFKHINNSETLFVMLEACGAYRIERTLARMAKGSVTQIMAESDCLGQVAVEHQCPRNRSCNLRNLKSVSQTGAVIITLGRKENLSFVLQAAK